MAILCAAHLRYIAQLVCERQDLFPILSPMRASNDPLRQQACLITINLVAESNLGLLPALVRGEPGPSRGGLLGGPAGGLDGLCGRGSRSRDGHHILGYLFRPAGFDPDARENYPFEIARDLGLLFASAWLVWRPRGPWALDNRLLYDDTSARTETGELTP